MKNRNTIYSKINKKGVSEVLGYILLVSFAIVMSFIVYQGLKTYVPAKTLECPDGVSLFIKDVSCTYNSTSEKYDLELIIKNNGRYNIAGYYIHASENPNQTVATTPLIENLKEVNAYKYNNAVLLQSYETFESGRLENFLNLNEENFAEYNNLSKKIYSLDLIPIRFQEEENRLRIVGCGKAILREKINCA